LARLWDWPSLAPADLEETLECYAIALLLGFRGRLAAPGQEEARDRLLVAAAAVFAARPPTVFNAPPVAEPEKAPAFSESRRDIWFLILIPALLTLAVFLKGVLAVESLPF
jgi:type VI protein secretion system component VasF